MNYGHDLERRICLKDNRCFDLVGVKHTVRYDKPYGPINNMVEYFCSACNQPILVVPCSSDYVKEHELTTIQVSQSARSRRLN